MVALAVAVAAVDGAESLREQTANLIVSGLHEHIYVASWHLDELLPAYLVLKQSLYIKLSVIMIWIMMTKFLSESCKTSFNSLQKGTCK